MARLECFCNFATVLIINDMRNKFLVVMLLVSLALNAVFALDVVFNHVMSERNVGVWEASKPAYINPVMRWKIKRSVKHYIKGSFTSPDLRYVSKDLYIEKAYVCPFNELFCVQAAVKIINLKEQIKADENNLQRSRHLLETQPDNEATRQIIADCENRLRENREALATQERIILSRDTSRDGKFMGYFVRHRWCLMDKEGNRVYYNVRYMVKSNGKYVEYDQHLVAGNDFNYDNTCAVIRAVLAGK